MGNINSKLNQNKPFYSYFVLDNYFKFVENNFNFFNNLKSNQQTRYN